MKRESWQVSSHARHQALGFALVARASAPLELSEVPASEVLHQQRLRYPVGLKILIALGKKRFAGKPARWDQPTNAQPGAQGLGKSADVKNSVWEIGQER